MKWIVTVEFYKEDEDGCCWGPMNFGLFESEAHCEEAISEIGNDPEISEQDPQFSYSRILGMDSLLTRESRNFSESPCDTLRS